MKYLSILFLSLILFSCGDSNGYDEDNIKFFESVSKIKFPKDLKVLETNDNGEFEACGVFNISKDNLHYFKRKASFESIKKYSELNSYIDDFPNNLLKDSTNYFFTRDHVIKWYKCNGCAAITVYIDTLNLKMWCGVLYPDNSGDFCCKDSTNSK